MTRSRTDIDREIIGILGRTPESSAILKTWNGLFRELGMHATMERYACTPDTLHERLSAMLHFDRRGYLVAPDLQEPLVALLDSIEGDAIEEGRVDTVCNSGGVLRGFCLREHDDTRFALWFPASRGLPRQPFLTRTN